MSEIKRVLVVGGGIMGGGIAALAARQGFLVMVLEASRELADKTKDIVLSRFKKWHDNGKISSEELVALRDRVGFSEDPRSVHSFEPEILIEAIVEKLEAKVELFRELDHRLPDSTIFASNTSTLPITKLASATRRQDRFVGLHFFNPPTTMQLVEVIPGEGTSDYTIATATEFAKNGLKKTPIRVKDRPGFLVNRLLLPYLTEAMEVLQTYDISFIEIDKVAVDLGWPMGPYKLLDTVGIDTAYYASKVVAASEQSVVIPDILVRMVADHRLGDKVGSGFYKTASSQEPLEVVLRRFYPIRWKAEASTIYRRILAGFLREAVLALENEVASKDDIEIGAQLGLGCPKGGPLHWIDDISPRIFLNQLAELAGSVGPRFSAPRLLVDQKDSTFFESW